MATQSIDLRQARAKAAVGVVPPPPEKPSSIPLIQREVQIPFEYHAPDGALYQDSLTSRILSFDGKAGVARMVADLCNGRPFEVMAPEHQAWIQRVAYVTLHLTEIPPWVAEWLPIDNELLESIYLQCQAHDYIFFRSDPAQGEGAPTRSRVVVDSPLVAQATALRKREVAQ